MVVFPFEEGGSLVRRRTFILTIAFLEVPLRVPPLPCSVPSPNKTFPISPGFPFLLSSNSLGSEPKPSLPFLGFVVFIVFFPEISPFQAWEGFGSPLLKDCLTVFVALKGPPPPIVGNNQPPFVVICSFFPLSLPIIAQAMKSFFFTSNALVCFLTWSQFKAFFFRWKGP